MLCAVLCCIVTWHALRTEPSQTNCIGTKVLILFAWMSDVAQCHVAHKLHSHIKWIRRSTVACNANKLYLHPNTYAIRYICYMWCFIYSRLHSPCLCLCQFHCSASFVLVLYCLRLLRILSPSYHTFDLQYSIFHVVCLTKQRKLNQERANKTLISRRRKSWREVRMTFIRSILSGRLSPSRKLEN